MVTFVFVFLAIFSLNYGSESYIQNVVEYKQALNYSFHGRMKTFLLAVAVFTFCTCQSGGQDLEFLNLSSWTRCSSLCWCADDNHSRVYGRCLLDKLDESVDFNLSRQLYSL